MPSHPGPGAGGAGGRWCGPRLHSRLGGGRPGAARRGRFGLGVRGRLAGLEVLVQWELMMGCRRHCN